MESHPICNLCGGKGCEKCHSGWECIGQGCKKCAMGWQLGKDFKMQNSDLSGGPTVKWQNISTFCTATTPDLFMENE